MDNDNQNQPMSKEKEQRNTEENCFYVKPELNLKPKFTNQKNTFQVKKTKQILHIMTGLVRNSVQLTKQFLK